MRDEFHLVHEKAHRRYLNPDQVGENPDIEPTVIRCYPDDTAGRPGVVIFNE